MLGAIIGDIVGSKYEFNNTLDYDFEMFAEGSGFTDDSICTVAVAHASSFEDAIRLAISHGGDSDTIGATVGSIAEARFGIPDDIREKVMGYLPDDMMKVYQQFEEKVMG